MIEALAFGFFAYFGTEVGEFAHGKYDEHVKCRIETCEEQIEPEQTITITIQHNGRVVSETQIGADNE